MAKAAAAAHGLDPALVCAVCEQESAWRPGATRFEPAFKRRYIDPLGLPEPEATQRATSYGLMQVMGEVARERGYVNDITTLCDPVVGLAWGCAVLRHKLDVVAGDVTKGLLLYNGGGNAAYPVQVLARKARYEVAAP